VVLLGLLVVLDILAGLADVELVGANCLLLLQFFGLRSEVFFFRFIVLVQLFFVVLFANLLLVLVFVVVLFVIFVVAVLILLKEVLDDVGEVLGVALRRTVRFLGGLVIPLGFLLLIELEPRGHRYLLLGNHFLVLGFDLGAAAVVLRLTGILQRALLDGGHHTPSQARLYTPAS